MNAPLPLKPGPREPAAPLRFSTNDVPFADRASWLREVICREYADIEGVSPTRQFLSQQITIHSWDSLRLSIVHSTGVELERRGTEPLCPSHDVYLAVVLLSGHYVLEQDGKEAVLRPGDMTFYDMTRPHRIHCQGDYSKLLLSIPRPLLRTRMAGVEHCAAHSISGAKGIGAVASNFMRASGLRAGAFTPQESTALADPALDLVTLALASVRPTNFTKMIVRLAGLSARYLNDLFGEEGTSLMRYVWRRRLEHCAKEMTDPRHAGDRISEIAFRWGFNDSSHFCRSFKQRFGCAPRDFRQNS